MYESKIGVTLLWLFTIRRVTLLISSGFYTHLKIIFLILICNGDNVVDQLPLQLRFVRLVYLIDCYDIYMVGSQRLLWLLLDRSGLIYLEFTDDMDSIWGQMSW